VEVAAAPRRVSRRMWSGFSSEIETQLLIAMQGMVGRRMWSGFSSEIETQKGQEPFHSPPASHVERLLI